MGNNLSSTNSGGGSPIRDRGSPIKDRSGSVLSFADEDNYSSKALENIFEDLADQGLDEGAIAELTGNRSINSDEAQLTYGGNFTWVDVHYKMQVPSGISPLQWLNALTKRLLVLSDISFGADGTFRHPRDKSCMFPRKGIDLRWRYDAAAERIIIDFYQDSKRLKWRWDELKAKPEMTYPNTTPDFVGIGHVGKYTFKYEFLSFSGRGSGDSFSSDGSDESLLFNLEPITREGRNFPWWNAAVLEERKRSGAEGAGAVFAAPPGDSTIGEGSFGTVWLARERVNGNYYAVKNVFAKTGRRNTTDRAMAQNEFEIVEKIITKPHPNVVAFYTLESFTLARGELYVLVMEYCAGGDLQGILNSCATDNAARKYTPPPESFFYGLLRYILQLSTFTHS
jgi:hypothetical protein